MSLFKYSVDNFILRAVKWKYVPDIKELRSNPHLTAFDRHVSSQWEALMEESNAFRFKMDNLQKRILLDEHRGEFYVLEHNPARYSDRRPPQQCVELQQAFNPSLFNFTKISPNEILAAMERQSAGEQRVLENGALQHENVQSDTRDLLIINNAPLTRTHCLFVPDRFARRNQVLRRDTIESAIHLLLLSAHPGFRICYNSLCAYASVNHEHVHTWYTSQPIRSDMIQVTSTAKSGFFLTTDSPIVGFVFELNLADIVTPNPPANETSEKNQRPTVDLMQEIRTFSLKIHQFIELLLERNIPHNVNVCRKWRPESDDDSQLVADTLRVIVWPRQPVMLFEQIANCKMGDQFFVACAELAGHVILKELSRFENLTVDEIRSYFEAAALTPSEVSSLKEELLRRYGVAV